VIANLSKTSSGHEAYISRANNGYIHRI
jgi:hypothetical protein